MTSIIVIRKKDLLEILENECTLLGWPLFDRLGAVTGMVDVIEQNSMMAEAGDDDWDNDEDWDT